VNNLGFMTDYVNLTAFLSDMVVCSPLRNMGSMLACESPCSLTARAMQYSGEFRANIPSSFN
jgi:hypothetical protein